MKDALERHQQEPLVGFAAPHPLLKGVEENPHEIENRRISEALRSVKRQTQACIEELSNATLIANALRDEVSQLILQQGRVGRDDEIVLWRPEDYRHVPMMADHDNRRKSGSSKKKKKK
jgi:hypothetical protein